MKAVLNQKVCFVAGLVLPVSMAVAEPYWALTVHNWDYDPNEWTADASAYESNGSASCEAYMMNKGGFSTYMSIQTYIVDSTGSNSGYSYYIYTSGGFASTYSMRDAANYKYLGAFVYAEPYNERVYAEATSMFP